MSPTRPRPSFTRGLPTMTLDLATRVSGYLTLARAPPCVPGPAAASAPSLWLPPPPVLAVPAPAPAAGGRGGGTPAGAPSGAAPRTGGATAAGAPPSVPDAAPADARPLALI